jgi:uncharacterized protein YecT (DUF1311 family)
MVGRAAAVTLVVIAMAGAARAQFGEAYGDMPSHLYSTTYRNCMDRTSGITVEMHNCLYAEYVVTDGKLNAAYKKRMAQLSPARRHALRLSERRWLKDTKARCEAWATREADGGSLWPIIVDSCGVDANLRRIQVIRDFR